MSTNDKPAVIVGYIRVSTVGQADDGVSLDAQLQRIKAYAEYEKLPILTIERDELSGKRADNRPGLNRALDAVCAARGVLVFYSLSRVARNTRDMLAISDRLRRAGADLASLCEKIDTTTASGKFFFVLMAAIAELERDQISERTKMALGHKRARGERIGRIPYGYCDWLRCRQNWR